MRIFVQPPQRYANPDVPEGALILLGDNWNDFGFRTLYRLLLKKDGALQRIGHLKVLKKGQLRSEVPLPLGELEGGYLPGDYCSLGADLDYYERLFELGQEMALPQLRDLVVDQKRQALFVEEEGLIVSLYRDHDDPEHFYSEVRSWLEAGAAPPDRHRFSFAFRPGSSRDHIDFNFGPPGNFDVDDSERHPSFRTVVLVGRNGVGKTRLLAQLARVGYVPPAERGDFAEEGEFKGMPAFPSIVAVSYSAFDDFDPPRLAGDSIEQFADNIRQGKGRYAYCGMRDLADALVNHPEPAQLLRVSDLEALFAARIDEIRELGRFSLLAAVLKPILLEASFSRMVERPASMLDVVVVADAWNEALLENFLGNDAGAAFRPLSSGHKIVLHQLASLTAVLQRRGLALIDEPETHLHPPLLAALMTGLRTLLERQFSYAVIATHSPVVVQETLASQVLYVDSGEEGTWARKPDEQTFGENIGTLTREIFGLAAGASDYRRILELMVEDYGSADGIETALGSKLSAQARAHVVAAVSRIDNA